MPSGNATQLNENLVERRQQGRAKRAQSSRLQADIKVNIKSINIEASKETRPYHGAQLNAGPRGTKRCKHPANTEVESRHLLVNGWEAKCVYKHNGSSPNLQTVCLRDLSKPRARSADYIATVAMMGSYKPNQFPGVELHNSPSTQSLGVLSNASTIVPGKGVRRIRLCLLVLCLLLFVACILLSVFLAIEITTREARGNCCPHQGGSTSNQKVCNTADCLKIASEFTRNINISVDPCDNFYHYACDGWIRDNPIPPSGSEYITFIKVQNRINEVIRNLLEDDTNSDGGDAVQKSRDFYKSCMDEDQVERTAKDEIQRLIDSLGSWGIAKSWEDSTWSWEEALLKIHSAFKRAPLFVVEVEVNSKNTTQYIIKLLPADFSLGGAYYAKNDTKTISAYIDYMAAVGLILGGDNTTTHRDMEDVIELEKQLSKLKPTDLQKRVYHPMPLKELKSYSEQFDFTDYLRKLFRKHGVVIGDDEIVNVPSAEYLYNMTKIVRETSNRTLSNYFIWTLLRNLVPFLSKPFREAEQTFLIRVAGVKKSPSRWQQCTNAANNLDGLVFATGALWVKEVFDKRDIPRIHELMDWIRKAFRDEVRELDWLDHETREQIYEKERAMLEKFGYPMMCVNETLLNQYYDGLKISKNHFLLNQVNITEWNTKYRLARLREPVDKEEWYTGPQTVNAFYMRTRNEINVHAAILASPFYHGSNAPRAINFGGIGMVLAHELSHGFDDVGRLYNKNGEIVAQWWSNYSIKGFANKTECMVEQYNNYSVNLPGLGRLYLRGENTLGENIADNGGLKVAFRAYENWIKQNGEEAIVPGLKKTNHQMFFISYAQLWCSEFSTDKQFSRINRDSHSLPYFRVIGALQNSEEFAEAFHCPKGSYMNPVRKCRVW
ncbi:endothelin-converting enzyme 2 [Nematostella vectensis]|uniref:endothelin-converting enzyme 2 n=1 Tax=Nematostella vectensis TaxID=45351 RepID=UPI00207755A6|nr:endothelin-converting enzyme 2 [Nematostella vectensis]